MWPLEYYLGAIIIVGCLCSCETTDSNGNTTRLDPDATREVINAGFGIYDRVRASQQQPYYPPQPAAYPQYYPTP